VKKLYRFKVNGDTLQFFENDQYVGSMSVRESCLFLKSGKKLKECLAQ